LIYDFYKECAFYISNLGVAEQQPTPSPPTGTQYIYCCTRIVISAQSVAYHLPL